MMVEIQTLLTQHLLRQLVSTLVEQHFMMPRKSIYHAYINHATHGIQDMKILLFRIARTGANCVRLVITDGQQYNKTSF